MLMTIHIAAGSIGLVAGAVALLTRKGGKLHRRGGLVFVVAMLAMSASAIPLAVLAQKPTSVMGGALTIYLVLTSLLTMRRRPTLRLDWIGVVTALAGFSISIVFFSLGFEGLRSATGSIEGLTPEPMFVFGSVALLAALGDLRMLLARAVSRAYRIARHLWRMCFALLMAAVSFFLGQAQVLPELLRNSPVPAFIPLAVIVLMFYWILRVRLGQAYRTVKR